MLRPAVGSAGHVEAVEEDPAHGRGEQTGDDVEHRRLAAAARAEQRVGAAVLPGEVDARRARRAAVDSGGQAVEPDLSHGWATVRGWRASAPVRRVEGAEAAGRTNRSRRSPIVTVHARDLGDQVPGPRAQVQVGRRAGELGEQ